MSSTTESNEILLTESGFVTRLIRTTPISNADKLIQDVFGSAGVTLPFVAENTHLRSSPQTVWAATLLPKLTIRTTFALITLEPEDDDIGRELKPILVPDFRGESGSVPMALEWTPPTGCDLYFISAMNAGDYGGHDGNVSHHHKCYLVAYDTNHPFRGQYLLPIPNQYGDGSLCMGSGWDNDARRITRTKQNFLGRHTEALKYATESSWNADLLDNKAAGARMLFRFDGAGMQAASDGDWTTHSTKIGNNNCDWVYSILKGGEL